MIKTIDRFLTYAAVLYGDENKRTWRRTPRIGAKTREKLKTTRPITSEPDILYQSSGVGGSGRRCPRAWAIEIHRRHHIEMFGRREKTQKN